MKMLLFKMIFVVVIMLAVPYFIMGGGKMPDFLGGILDPSAKKAKLPENISSVVTDKDVTVYKWVDDQGRTHFSGIKPVGQDSEAKHLRPDTNIVQAVKITEEEEEASSFGGLISLNKKDKNKKNKKGGGKIEPYQMENPYTPEGMQNLIQGAQNIQGLMDQRSEAQQKAVNGK